MNYIDSFLASAASVPDVTAIVDCNGTRTTSYAALDALSDRAAGKLHQLHCQKGDFVVIRMERSMEYLAAYLGALKAGCAVVPTMPSYPQERIDYICADCNAAALVTEDFFDDIDHYSSFEDLAEGSSPALMIYTSGSTGKPKGVVHTVAGLCNAVERSRDIFSGLKQVRFAATAPMSFIVHVTENLLVFAAGGTVHLLPDSARASVQALTGYYARHEIDCGFISPQILRLIEDGSLRAKRIFTGSEKLSGVCFSSFELWNLFGQSETGAAVCGFPVDKPYDSTPIGKTFGDAVAVIIDEDGRELPDGETGEICFIDHFGVAYFNQPEQSAKSFVKLPDGRTQLHTGDLGYKDENGNVVYLSRKDWMLKINGQRVEPGEIEAVIRKLPHITNTAVKGFEKQNGKILLCAYYTADTEVSGDTVRNALKQELPGYMIPAHFVQLSAFPLNQNGKLDRRALEEPEADRSFDAPETQTQQMICSAMEKVLGLERIGIREDFFDLGGDSISCAHLLLELQELHLDTAKVYRCRTAELLAQALEDAENAEDMDEANRIALLQDQPLLPYQTFYVDWMLYSPQKLTCSNPMYYRFPLDSVDPVKLRQAVGTVLHHYATYGTIFCFNDDGELVQRYRPDLIEPIRMIYTTQRDYTNNLRQEFLRPYHVTDELQYRMQICVTEEACYLMIDFNHTIGDGASFMTTVRAIFDVLQGKKLAPDYYYLYLQRHKQKLAEPQFRKEAEELRSRYNRPGFDRFPTPDFDSRDNRYIDFSLLADRSYGEYRKAAEAKKVSFGTAMVAAGLLAMSRYNRNPKVEVEWIYHGRDEDWKQDLVGLTICAIPTAVDLDEIHSADELLAEVRRQAATGIRHADHSFAVEGVSPAYNDYMKVVNEESVTAPENLPAGTTSESPFDLKNAVLCTFQFLVFPPANEDDPLPLCLNYNKARYSKESAQKFGAEVLKALDECLF